MKQTICIYLFEGFSDWEISFLTPELKKLDQWKVEFVTDDGKEVTSMGGLRVIPTKPIHAIDFSNVVLLIVPGGKLWESELAKQTQLFTIIDGLKGDQCMIAGICGATVLLAQKGLLNDNMHTSNDLNYLQAMVSEYRGADLYLNQNAVVDHNIITANGISPIEFTREILLVLNVNKEYVEQWFQLFKYGIWKGE
ncbi:DJ-1/PfpI family protein [Myroides pelagicus]|uniref:Glutamine amidotransferase n=1 Tax=Myroides pelagicus TaxID=270914 RepID=A0A7K1GKZ0_9FLAO|nr:DJ-1/PfpI family protein [Myroides pelagicus]MEC4112636.1 DJ-1/PfpI family protein [Myroides pelagicus]MTH29486.1 glutamine amidotransferase [Myroides pelagicus]